MECLGQYMPLQWFSNSFCSQDSIKCHEESQNTEPSGQQQYEWVRDLHTQDSEDDYSANSILNPYYTCR